MSTSAPPSKKSAQNPPARTLTLAEMPETLPLFPLSGVLLLPRGRLPLNVFEPRYLAMVEEAFRNKRLIGMIQPVGEGLAPNGQPKLFQVGCAGRIHSFNETEDGRYLISLMGVARFRVVEELDMREGFRRVKVDWQHYANDLDSNKNCLIDRACLLDHLRRYFNLQGIASEWDVIEKTDDHKLITSLAMVCPFSPCEKQALLEATSMEECCNLLNTLMDMAGMEDEDGNTPKH